MHPGATDKPDFASEDTHCDGIDGDVDKAIFVDGGGGLDAGSGTRDFPKKTISNAIPAAKPAGKDVYVAAGTYPEMLTLDTGGSIFGGYTPNFSARSATEPTTIPAIPQAAVADGKTGITLQLLTLLGGTATQATGGNSYGLRVSNGAKVALDHVTSTGGAASAGATGGVGAAGTNGTNGTIGGNGSCGTGGSGGTGPAGGAGANAGGKGGNGAGIGANGVKGGDGLPIGSVGGRRLSRRREQRQRQHHRRRRRPRHARKRRGAPAVRRPSRSSRPIWRAPPGPGRPARWASPA